MTPGGARRDGGGHRPRPRAAVARRLGTPTVLVLVGTLALVGCHAGEGDGPAADPPAGGEVQRAAGPAGSAGSLPVAARAGELAVRGPWIRPVVVVPGDTVPVNSAAYFVVENRGAEPDRLLEVRSEVARRVEVHRSVVEEGMARMRPADSVVVEPGGRTALEPGGLHVMLMGVEEPISAGDTVELVLVFREAGEVTVPAPARQLPPGGG